MDKTSNNVEMFMKVPMTDIFKKCDELKLQNRTNESLERLTEALKIQLKDGPLGKRQLKRLRSRLTGHFRNKVSDVPKKVPSKPKLLREVQNLGGDSLESSSDDETTKAVPAPPAKKGRPPKK